MRNFLRENAKEISSAPPNSVPGRRLWFPHLFFYETTIGPASRSSWIPKIVFYQFISKNVLTTFFLFISANFYFFKIFFGMSPLSWMPGTVHFLSHIFKHFQAFTYTFWNKNPSLDAPRLDTRGRRIPLHPLCTTFNVPRNLLNVPQYSSNQDIDCLSF